MTRTSVIKVCFWGITLVFWCFMGFMLAEFRERHVSRHDVLFDKASPILAQAEMRDLELYEATAGEAPRPPAAVLARYPALELLEGATGQRLVELAAQWEAIIFHCDLDGVIIDRYVAPDAGLITQLAEEHSDISRVTHLLSGDRPEYRADIVFRMELSVKNWVSPPLPLPHIVGCVGPFVDYMIPLEGVPNAGFRFLFQPFILPEGGDTHVYVVVFPWRWQAFAGGFRPNYYEKDTYPQFPKSEFWTNSRGFRDDEIVVPKPAEVYRIACIGGSTTLEGPRNDLTYPKMLEALLREHFASDAIEVINCGVDGGTIRGQGHKFDDVLAIEPDLVVHYNFVNDTKELLDTVIETTTLRGPLRRWLVNRGARSKFLTRRCRWLWGRVMPKQEDYAAGIQALILPALEELCERSRERGADFAIASFACPDIHGMPKTHLAWFRNIFWFQQIIPIQYEDYVLSVDAFNAVARSFCDEKGIHYIPIAENMRGGLETFTDHCHMRIPAIQRKAELMFEHLRDVVSRALSNTSET